MRGVLDVAKEKNSTEGKKAERKKPVRLDPAFKKRLHHVALDLEKDMGVIIQEQLEVFVRTEEARMEAARRNRRQA